MKKVYICSPFKGRSEKTTEKNRQKALMYCRFAYENGCNPFAPHAFYPEFLDEMSVSERKDGLRMAQEWMWAFQELWVFGNIISPGMLEEIKLANILEIKVRYFNEHMEEERE
jgi:hypothetical protein